METVLFILCIISSLAAFAVSAIKFLHFFQLNSYRAKIHSKWICKNFSKWAPNLIGGIVLIFLSIWDGIGAKWMYLTTSALLILLSLPKKAKKPIVYTMRVKRLLVTTFILLVLLAAAGYHSNAICVVISSLFLLSPGFIMISNIINRPLELCITKHYINDAKKLLSSSDAKVIGITGSYGKTSVKYYLSTLLKSKYNTLMTPESYNTPMGVVITIRSSLSALNEVFVCEMGAKRVGEIKEICDIVYPELGIITSVGPQHLETFKSLDNVKKTKFELADSLPVNGTLFVNADDENIMSYIGDRKHIGYSVKGNGDYNAEIISLGEKGTTFKVTSPAGECEEFSTKLIGMHNVLNITGAIAVANSMGIDMKRLKAQVSKLEQVPHRLELVKKGNDLIIDDAYNSNPTGTKAALETLSYFEGMKILLTPGMVELGAKQEELNREFGKNAAKVCDYVILVGKHQTEPIYTGLKDENYSEDKIFVAETFSEAITHAYGLNAKGERKIILLENDLPDNY